MKRFRYHFGLDGCYFISPWVSFWFSEYMLDLMNLTYWRGIRLWFGNPHNRRTLQLPQYRFEIVTEVIDAEMAKFTC